MIIELETRELETVNGGWFWIALPIVISAGYTLGKDRAERDNKQDELDRQASQ